MGDIFNSLFMKDTSFILLSSVQGWFDISARWCEMVLWCKGRIMITRAFLWKNMAENRQNHDLFGGREADKRWNSAICGFSTNSVEKRIFPESAPENVDNFIHRNFGHLAGPDEIGRRICPGGKLYMYACFSHLLFLRKEVWPTRKISCVWSGTRRLRKNFHAASG